MEISANKGYTNIVQILLEHLNAKDTEEYLRESLSSAAVHGRFATVKALLDEHAYLKLRRILWQKLWEANGLLVALSILFGKTFLPIMLGLVSESF